jgi:Retrotransposon gag protein
MANSRFNLQPEPFFGNGGCPELYLASFRNLRTVWNLDEKESIALILYSLRGDAGEWARIFQNKHDLDTTSFDEFERQFIARFKIHRSTLQLRQQLRAKVWLENEPISDFLRSIRSICEKINPSMLETEMLDHAIEGLPDAFLNSIGNPKTLLELETTIANIQARAEILKRRKLAQNNNDSQIANSQIEVLNIEQTFEKLEQKMCQILNAFQHALFKKISRMNLFSTGIHKRRNRKRIRPPCSHCGKIGHRAKRCYSKFGHPSTRRLQISPKFEFPKDKLLTVDNKLAQEVNFHDSQFSNLKFPIQQNQRFPQKNCQDSKTFSKIASDPHPVENSMSADNNWSNTRRTIILQAKQEPDAS